jgi:hypothetical protein
MLVVFTVKTVNSTRTSPKKSDCFLLRRNVDTVPRKVQFPARPRKWKGIAMTNRRNSALQGQFTRISPFNPPMYFRKYRCQLARMAKLRGKDGEPAFLRSFVGLGPGLDPVQEVLTSL